MGRQKGFDEFQERVWDLFYSRSGNNQLQATTAVTVRTYLTGVAYQSAKKIPRENLVMKVTDGDPVSEDGIKLLLSTMSADLVQENPMRASELFDRVFYSLLGLGSEKVTKFLIGT